MTTVIVRGGWGLWTDEQADKFLCHSNLFWKKISRAILPHLVSTSISQELSLGIDDVSLDPLVDQWAHSPLGAGYWQSIIKGHNTFSLVSQVLIVIQGIVKQGEESSVKLC